MPSSYWLHIYSMISRIKFTDWLKVNGLCLDQPTKAVDFLHTHARYLIDLLTKGNK